jgi:hypothetical protein
MSHHFSFSGVHQRSAFRPIGSLIDRSAFAPARWALTLFLSVGGPQLLLPSTARGGDGGDVVTVYSKVNPAYVRTHLADGSFKPESYAFGEGGNLTSSQRDDTIDKLRFLDVAHIIAPSLAAENYRPCDTADPRHTDLLVMVYWGATVGTDTTSSSPQYQIAQALIPPPSAPLSPPPNGQGGTAMVSDPSTSGRAGEGAVIAAIQAANDSALQQSLMLTAMANRQRDRQNVDNATVIGYLTEMKRLDGHRVGARGLRRQDLVDEIEESRYYVVLLAYDFQILLQHKQRKLLWETRFSIPERRNDFSKQLAAMAEAASRFFGQNSEGLVHKPLREGHVILGELKDLGDEPDDK